MIPIAQMSVNGVYSTTRRLHDVLPSSDHSVSLQVMHLEGLSVSQERWAEKKHMVIFKVDP